MCVDDLLTGFLVHVLFVGSLSVCIDGLLTGVFGSCCVC